MLHAKISLPLKTMTITFLSLAGVPPNLVRTGPQEFPQVDGLRYTPKVTAGANNSHEAGDLPPRNDDEAEKAHDALPIATPLPARVEITSSAPPVQASDNHKIIPITTAVPASAESVPMKLQVEERALRERRRWEEVKLTEGIREIEAKIRELQHELELKKRELNRVKSDKAKYSTLSGKTSSTAEQQASQHLRNVKNIIAMCSHRCPPPAETHQVCSDTCTGFPGPDASLCSMWYLMQANDAPEKKPDLPPGVKWLLEKQIASATANGNKVGEWESFHSPWATSIFERPHTNSEGSRTQRARMSLTRKLQFSEEEGCTKAESISSESNLSREA